MHFDEEMGFQFLGPRSTVLSPSDPRPPTVSGAEGDGIDRRCAAGAARSNTGRGKSEDRAMTSWFLVGPRYSPRVSRYLRRRLSNATRLKRAASSRGVDEPPRKRVKGRL